MGKEAEEEEEFKILEGRNSQGAFVPGQDTINQDKKSILIEKPGLENRRITYLMEQEEMTSGWERRKDCTADKLQMTSDLFCSARLRE